MNTYRVASPIMLGYDSHTRQLTPSRFKRHGVGALLTLDTVAPDGTVWFFDEDGERGKIDAGSVENLLVINRRNGYLVVA